MMSSSSDCHSPTSAQPLMSPSLGKPGGLTPKELSVALGPGGLFMPNLPLAPPMMHHHLNSLDSWLAAAAGFTSAPPQPGSFSTMFGHSMYRYPNYLSLQQPIPPRQSDFDLPSSQSRCDPMLNHNFHPNASFREETVHMLDGKTTTNVLEVSNAPGNNQTSEPRANGEVGNISASGPNGFCRKTTPTPNPLNLSLSPGSDLETGDKQFTLPRKENEWKEEYDQLEGDVQCEAK